MDQKDGKDNPIKEIQMDNGEKIRVTKVDNSWHNGQPAFRIQIREENGHLRQGPEVPVSYIQNVFGAVVELATKG
ncbi:MAG: hypothetical protein HQK83_04645 [Fibrobacteria bacterium]|nr:hypothetical protein [Fibrobacteria bacterium]